MNQYGDLLYVGQYKLGIYRNWGDYAENLDSLAIEEIMKKLYYFEENFEDLIDKINQIGNINPVLPNKLKEALKNAK